LSAMPVHRDREKKEGTAEEMEVEDQEQEGSSSEEEDSETSSVSEDGDKMDEEDCERRRMECLDEMSNLEKQFTDLKDQLYRERLTQVNSKLAEVEAGRAAEYLDPLAVLLENMQVRTKVAGIYKELCLESVKNKYKCEIQAACQHWESEKLLLFDTGQSELEEKIRRLEEDRHSIDITSGNRVSTASCHLSANVAKLSRNLSDWTAIRKVGLRVSITSIKKGDGVNTHPFKLCVAGVKLKISEYLQKKSDRLNIKYLVFGVCSVTFQLNKCLTEMFLVLHIIPTLLELGFVKYRISISITHPSLV
uniref:BRMS1 like transcriptional repressor b n=1 Tax=Hippocampus comes TaxID=109280 RepID=A0A3Q2XZ30_HIPCM